MSRRRTHIGRRAFLGAAGAAMVATLASSGWTAVSMSGVDRQWNVDMSNLDAFHAAQGDKGVIKAFAAANENDAINMMFWIRDRGLTSLYALPVSALGDSRDRVRKTAAGVLFVLPPADLKPYLPAVQQAASDDPDVHVRDVLSRLSAKIEGA